jgi:hypothetical protein
MRFNYLKLSSNDNASLPYWNLPRSGGDAGENLIMVNITHTLKNLKHPLDKVFGGIPAGSQISPMLQ